MFIKDVPAKIWDFYVDHRFNPDANVHNNTLQNLHNNLRSGSIYIKQTEDDLVKRSITEFHNNICGNSSVFPSNDSESFDVSYEDAPRLLSLIVVMDRVKYINRPNENKNKLDHLLRLSDYMADQSLPIKSYNQWWYFRDYIRDYDIEKAKLNPNYKSGVDPHKFIYKIFRDIFGEKFVCEMLTLANVKDELISF